MRSLLALAVVAALGCGGSGVAPYDATVTVTWTINGMPVGTVCRDEAWVSFSVGPTDDVGVAQCAAGTVTFQAHSGDQPMTGLLYGLTQGEGASGVVNETIHIPAGGTVTVPVDFILSTR